MLLEDEKNILQTFLMSYWRRNPQGQGVNNKLATPSSQEDEPRLKIHQLAYLSVAIKWTVALEMFTH